MEIRGFILCCLLAALVTSENSDLKLPSFDEGMGSRSITWGWWSSSDRQWVDILDSLYEQNIRGPVLLGTTDAEDSPRIPKLIHQVWLGGEPLPPRFKQWRDSWQRMHPDWKHILWTEAEAEELEMINREAYDNAPNLGAKSDALRLEAVWRFGGLYIDTDFECLKPFDVLHERLDFFAGVSNVGALEVSNGIFAASKRHPLVEAAIRIPEEALFTPGVATQLKWIGMPTITASGPGRFTRVVMGGLVAARDGTASAWWRHVRERKEEEEEEGGGMDIGRAVIFPTNFFFPLPNSVVSAGPEVRASMLQETLAPETIALHHWAGSWLKRQIGLPAWSETVSAGEL